MTYRHNNKNRKSAGKSNNTGIQKQTIVNPPKPTLPVQPTPVETIPAQALTQDNQDSRVKSEHSSLQAYAHIMKYLNGKKQLSKEEVTAILRLSQHLRVFGLLSAFGYLCQAREGKIQEKTSPIWKSLLGQMINSDSLSERELIEKTEQMARGNPVLYMATWRRAMVLSNHWNFWARAYQEEDKK